MNARSHRGIPIVKETGGGFYTGGRRQGRIGAVTTYTATVNGDELVSYTRAGLVAAIDERLDETPEQRQRRIAHLAALTAKLSR